MIAGLRKRLQTLEKNPDRLTELLSTASMPRTKKTDQLPAMLRDLVPMSQNLFAPRPERSASGRVTSAWQFDRRYINCEVLNYTSLIKRLNAAEELQPELLAIAQVMGKSWLRIAEAFDGSHPLEWPYGPEQLKSLKEPLSGFDSRSWREYMIYNYLVLSELVPAEYGEPENVKADVK